MTEAEIQQWADEFVACPHELASVMWAELGKSPDNVIVECHKATSTCGIKVSEHMVRMLMESGERRLGVTVGEETIDQLGAIVSFVEGVTPDDSTYQKFVERAIDLMYHKVLVNRSV